MPHALGGVRVIEFGSFITAPYCSKLLADLGADVIKIEPPEEGDESRTFGPFHGDVPHPEKSGLFLYLNCNKRGITLKVETPTGRNMFRELVEAADILIENQQPGLMKDLGLDYDDLKKANPRLIMTSITTFGRTGPYAGYKGCDLLAWHGSGCAHKYLGEPDREPLRSAWYLADHWAAMNATTATMLALEARESIGRGQHVDISAADNLAAFIMGYQVVTGYRLTGEWKARGGAGKQGGAPTGMYPCMDGYVSMRVQERHHWESLVKVMGSPAWTQTPMYQNPKWDQPEYEATTYPSMKPWLDSHTKAEIFEACQQSRVPVGPVYNSKDLVENRQLASRRYFADIDHPAVGKTTVPGEPYAFSQTPWTLRRPAPLLGQHNQEVYCGLLGFSNRDVAGLYRGGVI